MPGLDGSGAGRAGPVTETAIVTGGGRGIGRASALRLAEAGYEVSVWDLDGDAARAAADEIAERGGRARPHPLDVADEEEVGTTLAAVEEAGPPVSVLVNNAGILRLTPIDGLDLADWDQVIRVNLRGPLVCTRAVVPGMKRRGRGAIVNVVSNVVAAARLHNGAYAAAKAGLLGLTRVLALELAPHRIRVNAVSPGSTRTELMDAYDDAMMESLLEGSLERYRIGIPLGRFADPADHANAVAFLVSDAAAHVTGQNLFIDGGQTLA